MENLLGDDFMKAIINVRIYDFINYIDNGYIIFDKKIIETGNMKDFNKTMERIDGNRKLIIPGLVNFHTHIYSTLFRGLNMHASPQTFRNILEDIWWKYDSQLQHEDIGLCAQIYSTESIKSGVTAIVDHHASGEIAGSLDVLRNVIKNSFGLKGMFCFETSDRFDVDECIKENLTAILMGDGIFGLHSSLTLSDETLLKSKSAAIEVPIHVHIAESIEDEEYSLIKYKKNVIERFDDFDLLNKNSILAHCVNINEKEAEIIGKRECIVAINPSSNMNNAVGLFNYSLYKKNNLNIVVGTDGLGVNIAKEWQNLYFTGKQSMNDPSGIKLNDIRNYLIKSYELFNEISNYKIGKFENGYDADFIVLDYLPPTPINEDNVFSHIFFGAFDNLRPSEVFVNGEYKVKDYKSQLKFEINYEIVNRLWKRIEEYNEIRG